MNHSYIDFRHLLQMYFMKLQLGKRMFFWCHTGKQEGILSIKLRCIETTGIAVQKINMFPKSFFVLLAVGLQKPNPKSKAKDRQDALSKRLALWKDGEISKLKREGRIIQSRIGKFKGANQPDKAKIFAKLELEGQINSALCFLSETSNGGVLTLSDDILTQLKQKHPEPQPAKLESVLYGPVRDEIPESRRSMVRWSDKPP